MVQQRSIVKQCSLFKQWLCFLVVISGIAFPIRVAGQQADLVVVGKHLLTVDPQTAGAEAVAVRDGKIAAIGSAAELESWIGDQTNLIRLRDDQTLLPGLIESHGHFLGLGQSLRMLDLRPQTTWEAIVADVAAVAQEVPQGTWIVGRGWHQSKWQTPPIAGLEGYPVHDSLSAAVPDHPVLLVHASGHASFANQAAMRLARLTAETPNPPGGEIVRKANGEATGLFRETAAGLIQSVHQRSQRLRTPAQSREDFRRAVQLAVEECHRWGITSFHDAGSDVATVVALRQMSEAGELPVRLYVMIRDSNRVLREQLAKQRVIDGANGFLTVRAIKKSIDGALGPHGAWLLSPYEDMPQSAGLATLSIEETREAIELAKEYDYQVCIHAIGDRANREVLDLYQQALPIDQLKQARWRIEHAQHLDPADIPRFGQLGVIAAMQGIHCTSDAPFVYQRLGERRAATGAYRWRQLLDSGAVICNGTDAPVEPLNPFACLRATIDRQLKDGSVFFGDQAMTFDEALASYTIQGAFAAFQEQQLGSLSVGKQADMVIVDRDLTKATAGELAETAVDATIVAGRIVYQR